MSGAKYEQGEDEKCAPLMHNNYQNPWSFAVSTLLLRMWVYVSGWKQTVLLKHVHTYSLNLHWINKHHAEAKTTLCLLEVKLNTWLCILQNTTSINTYEENGCLPVFMMYHITVRLLLEAAQQNNLLHISQCWEEGLTGSTLQSPSSWAPPCFSGVTKHSSASSSSSSSRAPCWECPPREDSSLEPLKLESQVLSPPRVPLGSCDERACNIA